MAPEIKRKLKGQVFTVVVFAVIYVVGIFILPSIINLF